MNKIAFLPILLALNFVPSLAETTTATSNTSTGSSNRLTISITNTSGVQSSASMTPNFDVYTSAKLVVAPGSTSAQDIIDPQAAISANSGSTGSTFSSGAQGIANGAGSSSKVIMDESTYEVRITPKYLCTGDSDCTTGTAIDKLSYNTASGSASGNITNTLSIDSTSSNFVNTFVSNYTDAY